jgi:hypothetical protein
MPDDNTAGATQAAATATTPAQAATTTTTDSQALKSNEDYEKMIADLRKENASNRIKLKAVEDAEAARQLAALSDAEKLQKRAEQAEKQIQQYKKELVNAQVRLAAKDKGIIDPDMAALALHDKLEFDDDGMPSNLDKALDDLIKAKPYLVPKADEAPPESPAQTANRAPTVPAMNPGRSNIASPGQNAPGRIPRITDPGIWKS